MLRNAEKAGRAGLQVAGTCRAGRGAKNRDWAYPALVAAAAAAAAAAARDRGRPSCAAGSGETPGIARALGGQGLRGGHARVGGAERSREAWVLGEVLSGEGAAKSPPPLPFFLHPPPTAFPPSAETGNHSRPAPPRLRPRPRPSHWLTAGPQVSPGSGRILNPLRPFRTLAPPESLVLHLGPVSGFAQTTAPAATPPLCPARW